MSFTSEGLKILNQTLEKSLNDKVNSFYWISEEKRSGMLELIQLTKKLKNKLLSSDSTNYRKINNFIICLLRIVDGLKESLDKYKDRCTDITFGHGWLIVKDESDNFGLLKKIFDENGFTEFSNMVKIIFSE